MDLNYVFLRQQVERSRANPRQATRPARLMKSSPAPMSWRSNIRAAAASSSLGTATIR